MQTPREVKRHIRTVREIWHLTRAMKLVAAAKLRQAQARVEAERPFAKKISEVLVDISSFAAYEHPLMTGRDPRRIGVMVVTSDRGLCGTYNDDVIAAAVRLVADTCGPANARIIAIGRVGARVLREAGLHIIEERSLVSRRPTFSLARAIAARIARAYEAEEIDHMYLVYSRFYSVTDQRPRVFRLIPASPASPGSPAAQARESVVPGACIFEPSAREIVDHLVFRYLDAEVYRALLEAEAGERGARLTAMSAATDNAEELAAKLTLRFNQARQAQITREIADIIGGAEALAAAPQGPRPQARRCVVS